MKSRYHQKNLEKYASESLYAGRDRRIDGVLHAATNFVNGSAQIFLNPPSAVAATPACDASVFVFKRVVTIK